ncbi:phosphate-starvation-inducible PsiE family protein [Thermodesulfobacteriota bacterium]
MKMTDLLQKFEHLVVKTLLVMMAIVVFLATLELCYILIKDIIKPPILILEINDLLEIFGMFMLVLIGLELFESIQVYHKDRIIRVEVVIMVAIIAVSRKVIILDYKSLSSFTLLQVGVGILCLGLTYMLLKVKRWPFTKSLFRSPRSLEVGQDLEQPDKTLGKPQSD